MPAPAIAVEELGKSFGSRWLFRQLSLSVPDGSIVVIVGPSGVGKTTLLRVIAGLDREHEGRVYLHGRDVTTEPPRARGLAFLFQSPVLYPFMTAFENIAFPLRAQGMDARNLIGRVRSVAERLEVHHVLPRRPDTLSGGERQRVALARAFAAGSRLRLLDEPLKGSLEPTLRRTLREQIGDLHREMGGTTCIVTHDQEEGLELADHLLIMLPDLAPLLVGAREAYRRPPNVAIALFVGGGTVLEGTYEPDDSIIIGADGCRYPVCPAIPAGPRVSGLWVVRPEGVRLDHAPNADWEIVDVTYQGPRCRAVVRRAGMSTRKDAGGDAQTLTASIPPLDWIVKGEGTRVTLDGGRLLEFHADGTLRE